MAENTGCCSHGMSPAARSSWLMGAESRDPLMTPEPWLRDLQEGYLQNLPAKIEEIRVLARRLHEAPSDVGAVRALAHAVQRLVGSAGSYGFPAISEALQTSAGLLARADEGLAALSPPDLAHLLELLDGMTEASPPAR